MLAPKCATYNGRSTFANPKYLKKAQSEKPHLYEIPYDTSDPANNLPQWNLPQIRKQAVRNTNVIAPGPSRNCPKHVSHQSPREKVGSNDMVHNYYLEKAKKSAQLQKDKEVNGKPSMIDPARLPNTANGCKPKPRNWQASMSSRVSNKDVHLGEHRKQKPFLKFNELQCPTCKKCLYSANHDECVLEYLSRLNPRASAQNKDAKSHKTTKRYMPVEKSSASKKPERQIPTGHRFSNKKTTTVPEKTMTPRSCLSWKPTGRIFKTIGLRWVPTRKIFAFGTNKVDSEPAHGSRVDIPHIHACKQTLGLSAETSARMVSQKMKSSKRRLIAANQASVLMAMMSDHNSSDLAPQRQEMSVENDSSGLVPQGQKASDYDNSNPVPNDKNVVPSQKRQIVTTRVGSDELCYGGRVGGPRFMLLSQNGVVNPRSSRKSLLHEEKFIWIKASFQELIYVDDIVLGITNPKYSKRFEKLMPQKILKMSLMGEMKFFLGLQIHQSPKAFSDVIMSDAYRYSGKALLEGKATVPCVINLVILFSIHNDEWKSFQCHHQTALRMSMLVKDTRSQDGIDDKDNDKGSKSRSQSMKEQTYNKEQRKRPRPHELNDKNNLIDLMKEWCVGHGFEGRLMRECCFVVEIDAWLRGVSGFGIGEVALSTLDVLQRFGFFLQMGFTLILATLDGLDVGLLGDVIDEDDCDDDD
ncbi:hypothetical protein Tco_1420796 [Tanacetum coccineum]